MHARILFTGALALALFATGCAGSPTPPSSTASSAEPPPVARVVGDLDADESSMRVAVDIAGLRAPGDLAPDATAFVLWVRHAAGEAWEKLGPLDYDAATRSASLDGVTIDGTSFELIVTAETDASPASPSPWVLFAQTVRA